MIPANKLRIAVLSVHSCPVGHLGARDTGGMSTFIRELAPELGKRGNLVDVYTRVHDPRDRQIYELGNNARLIHLKAGEDEQINKLAVYSYLPDFACNLENFRKNNDLRYDLVYSNYWLSGWVGRYLQQWWDVPHIITFHTLGAIKNAIGVGEDEPELRIETERDLIRDCHHVIATTEKEKEALAWYYDASMDKIGVVPCGVNLELFQPMNTRMARQQLGFTDGKIVLFVGRIEPLKGLEQLLKAIPYLKKDTKGLRLVVIGGDDQSQYEIERLKKLAYDLNIQDSVSFEGLIKHDRLPYFYNASDVCVIPSYYESFGLVALESLACGTPVVATDVGNLKNIIRQGETGYVLADNTPERLAEKIDLLLSRPNPDTKPALSIRESVDKYGWSNIAEAIVREFHLVLASYPMPVS